MCSTNLLNLTLTMKSGVKVMKYCLDHQRFSGHQLTQDSLFLSLLQVDVCKNNKHFQHRENRANRDYKAKESFPSITLSVCSVFSVLIFFGCGLSAL